MKMFINKYIKLLASAIISTLAASSCLNLDETKDGAYGYLTISGFDVDIQVEQLVPTKTDPVTLASLGVNAAPNEINAVFVLIKDGNSQTVEPNTELKLEAGSYTLNITYDNKGADGFGEPLFGEASYPVTINAGQNTPLKYSLPLMNSLLAVYISEELKKDFTLGSILIAYGEGTSITASETEYFFVPAKSEVIITATGTTAGVQKPLVHKFTTPAAAKFADVKFGKSTTDLPSIIMDDVSEGAFEGGLYFSPAELHNISSDHTVVYKYQLKGASDWTTATVSNVGDYKYFSDLTDGEDYLIKACVGNIESKPVEFTPVSLESCITVAADSGYPQHYTENNELAGTKMQASVKVELPSIVAKLATLSIEDGTFKKGSEQRGTFNLETKTLKNDTSNSIEIINSADWPYFPKGDGYILDAIVKCVLPNNRSITSDTVSSKTIITSPKPTFDVMVSAETSFSRYQNYKNGVTGYTLDLANTAGSGDDIMNICAKVGISGNILSKSHYQSLLSYSPLKYDTNTDLKTTSSTVGTLKAANLEGQSWQKHIISASFTFDEVVKSSSIDCHVTGLPYMASPPTNSDDYGWSSNFQTATNKIEWNSDGVRLEGISKSAKITSSSFYVPTNINTTLTVSTRMRTMSVAHIYAQSHLICRISGTEVINRYGIKGEKDWKGSSDNVEDYTGKGTGTLTTSNSTIDIENEYNKTEAYIYIYSVKLDYM